MFRLPEAWVWDFWLADDGRHFHVFFLYASKAIRDPEDRHFRASIGHAVSTDLRNWERVTDALVRSDPPAFDEMATWTGSVIRHPDGTWFLFYTGAAMSPAGNVQQIGYATSTDLYQWDKNPGNPVVQSDSRWYEKLSDGQWHDEAFRDPWVFADPDGHGFHMLITARANHGPADDRGVIGHAWSPNLRDWELRPPLTKPGQGFGQLEVIQVEVVDGRPVLIFSCLARDLSQSKRATGTTGGVWCSTAESLLGPYDIAHAQQVTQSSLYVGRIIQQRDSREWVFLAFRNDSQDGSFIGEIDDPQPFSWNGRSLTLKRSTATSNRST